MSKRKNDNECKKNIKKPKTGLNLDDFNNRKVLLDDFNNRKVLLDDFGKIYGWVLYKSASSWNFHSDSGCFYSVCTTESYTKGDWTAIYQPSKEMKEYDDGKYYIIIKNKKTITETMFKSLQPMITQVEKLFLESYNDILKITKNRWPTEVNGTIEDVAQIIYPLKLEKNLLKMCMELRGMSKKEEWRSHNYWTPEKLGNWLGYKKEYDSLFDDGNIKEDIVYDKNDLPEDLGHFTESAVPAII
jgi:hypothetical protein